MTKKAIITGITGQDGAYLAELLLAKGYIVCGTYRRTSPMGFWRLDELGIQHHPQLKLAELDLTDPGACMVLIQRFQPDEIYNLAAQSFVGLSFEQPSATTQINALGALNLLEAIRIVNHEARYYQASTSEMFGQVDTFPQDEDSPFHPRSPYGVAKLYAHWMTVNYREAHGIFAASGILFNHESPLRGREFVTRKITKTLAHIRTGQDLVLELGNLDSKRDWGYAKEYVEGMWRMLQAERPDTFVLATNRCESVRNFVKLSANAAGFSIEFEGQGQHEVGIDTLSGKTLVKVNPEFYRPAEVDLLVGNPAKAERVLGWTPRTTLEEICHTMIESDLRRIHDGRSF